MLTMIDMGVGNLGSVVRAFEHTGARVGVTSSPSDIAAAAALVLPGVGAFGDAMRNLASLGLVNAIRHAVLDRGVPLLGICVGMQVLASCGEEFGTHPGLGLVPGRVRALASYPGCRIPNMGWCDVLHVSDAGLFAASAPQAAYYFAHSYHFECDDVAHVSATVKWGQNAIVAAVAYGNVLGVQFHPEKSQDAGLSVLHAFWTQALAVKGN